jgi:hypothetical protein
MPKNAKAPSIGEPHLKSIWNEDKSRCYFYMRCLISDALASSGPGGTVSNPDRLFGDA